MSAPFGYVVNDKYVNIFVDTDTAFETDGDTNDAIITVEYSDAPAVGELTVENKGEVLDGFKGGLLASSYEKEFVYKEGSLAGAKIKVYAAEDIYTADNQKDADGNRIKYYSKGRPCRQLLQLARMERQQLRIFLLDSTGLWKWKLHTDMY